MPLILVLALSTVIQFDCANSLYNCDCVEYAFTITFSPRLVLPETSFPDKDIFAFEANSVCSVLLDVFF